MSHKFMLMRGLEKVILSWLPGSGGREMILSLFTSSEPRG